MNAPLIVLSVGLFFDSGFFAALDTAGLDLGFYGIGGQGPDYYGFERHFEGDVLAVLAALAGAAAMVTAVIVAARRKGVRA